MKKIKPTILSEFSVGFTGLPTAHRSPSANRRLSVAKLAAGWVFPALLCLPLSLESQEKKTKPLTPEQFRAIPEDLVPPPLIAGKPSPGKRVRRQLPSYSGSDVFHSVYLPEDYVRSGPPHPVIFEYAGNGPYQNRLGDRCTGRVEDCNMGFGISGGKNFIWVVIPFVSKDGQSNQRQWWGDVDASANYCRSLVKSILEEFNADPDRLVLCGFSRGSIACNYIGLHDDRTASLWAAMICHSHYDGVRRWSYEGSDEKSAIRRLKRLGQVPQLVTQERSTDAIRDFIRRSGVPVRLTCIDLPFQNHTDRWLLKDLPERKQLRDWLVLQLKDPQGPGKR